MRRLFLAAALFIAVVTLGFGGVYAILGRTPAMALLLHGGAMFLPVSPQSARLGPSVRRALAGAIGEARPDAFRRESCGTMEVQSGPGDAGGTTSKLSWMFGRWALPIALAVVERQR